MPDVRKLLSSCVLAAALAQAVPACAQSADLGPLLSGNSAPLTVKLGDLNADWRVFTLDGANGGYGAMVSAMMGGSATSDYFTKGDTVNAGGDVYLIAYSPHQEPLDYAAMMQSSGRPKPSKLSAGSILDLSLINLHTVGTLNGVHPFDLKQELAESARAASSIGAMYGGATVTASTESADTSEGASRSESRLKQLGLAYLQYVQDNDEKFPAKMDPASFQKALYPYVKSKEIFLQPGVNKPYLANTRLSGHSVADLSEPSSMVVFYESVPGSDGKRWVCLADGHVRQVGAADWTKLKKASKIP
jgi:hypothetical protein